jgi:hypothetical protein
MKIISALIALTLLANHSSAKEIVNDSDDYITNLSIISLIANSEDFDSKKIRVLGYLCELYSGGHALYLDKSDCSESRYDKGIRVFLSEGIEFRKKNQFIEVEGRYVDQTNFITTDAFSVGYLTAEKIRIIDGR